MGQKRQNGSSIPQSHLISGANSSMQQIEELRGYEPKSRNSRAPLSKRTKGKVIHHFWEQGRQKPHNQEMQSFGMGQGPLAMIDTGKASIQAGVHNRRRAKAIDLPEEDDGNVNYTMRASNDEDDWCSPADKRSIVIDRERKVGGSC